MNNNILADKEIHACTGCQVCAAACPTEAIVIELDSNGFYKPKILGAKCVQCGICKEVCYKYDSEILSTDINEEISTYAAKCKDNIILNKSSSGGLFTILGTYFIESGYKVAGVGYDYKNDIAVGRIVDTIEHLDELRGSKYMQSYSEETFREMLKGDLGDKYAVFGTPCQIYALNKRIAKTGKRNSFILIDIFCHGCPSLHLWTKYISYYKKNIGCTELRKIVFRSKKYGWHEYCHEFITPVGANITTSRNSDPFFDMFFGNQILNKACYDCRLRGSLRYSDMRLGDFWGAKYDMDTEGISLITCNTQVGKKVLKEIRSKLKLKPENFKNAIKAQSFKTVYPFDESKYRNNLEIIKGDKNISEIYYRYKEQNRERGVVRISKKLFLHCPSIIRRALRKIVHTVKEERNND